VNNPMVSMRTAASDSRDAFMNLCHPICVTCYKAFGKKNRSISGSRTT